MGRIHITGASGTGTTTLAGLLAAALDVRHFDADEYFWLPLDPPFTHKRPVGERNEKLINDLDTIPSWVLSGSVTGWGTDAERFFDLVVYLWVPTAIRVQRLRQRELARFGHRIAPGGEMHEGYEEFIAWAERYDSAGLEQRSRAVHEAWLGGITCPVLRIEGDLPNTDRLGMVLQEVSARGLAEFQDEQAGG